MASEAGCWAYSPFHYGCLRRENSTSPVLPMSSHGSHLAALRAGVAPALSMQRQQSAPEMKSLHLVTSDARRGAETFAVNLVDALNANGHRARVMALTASDAEEAHDVPVLGVQRRALGTLGSLRRAARGADVVVAHGSSTLEACAVGLAGSGPPFVYRTIGDPSYWVTTPMRQRWVGGLLRRAARNVALWAGAAEQLAVRYGIPPHRIDVIPNAVAAESFPMADAAMRAAARRRMGVEADRPCLAFIGALAQEKDVGVAIRATAYIDDAVLLIAGAGPERDWLGEQAEQQAPGRVRFLGPVADPADVYAAADLLLLPSRTEGMPGVLIEAALTGTPTVATAVGAVPEMLTGSDVGYLVAPGDPSAFATRVAEALEEGTRLSEQAVEVLRRRFSVPSVVQTWEETLQRARHDSSPRS